MEAIEERVNGVQTALAEFMATSNRIMRSLEERSAETARMMQRMDERSAESERMIERMDRKIAATDRGSAEMKAESDRSIAKMHADTDRSIAEMKAESRKHTLEMARIADRIGRFAEDIVAPDIPPIAEEIFGISQIEFEVPRVKRRNSRDRSRVREFDVVVAGNRNLLVTSVKATARSGDIPEFVAALKDIFDYFPEYRGSTLVPIFASMALSKDQVRRLTRLKIFAMALGQRTMELLNLDQVRALRANVK